MSVSFGSKHLLALQIDNGVTQVAELRISKKNVTVLKSFSVSTPMGTVGEDGTLFATTKFAKLLREQMTLHGIKTDRGVFCVNSDRIITREITIPNVKRGDILTMLSTNAQEYFPVDVSDYKLDYSVHEQVVENGAKMLRIQASAVPKQLIASYYDLAKTMEIGIVAIDFSGNSVLQAISANPGILADATDAPGSTYLIVNMYSGGTQLTFIKDDSIRLQRTISIGLDDRLEALMLANEQEEEQIIGYTAPEADEQAVADALEETYDKASGLAVAINRIIEYYYSVEGYGNGNIIGTVVGQGILLPKLTSHLFAELDISYRMLHKAGAQDDEQDAEAKKYGLYMPCIGACLAPLNLTDRAQGMMLENICAKRRWLERVAVLKRNFILIAGAAVFAGCVAISAFLAGVVALENVTITNQIKDYQQKIEAFSEAAKYNSIKLNAQSIRDLMQAYSQKLDQLEKDEQEYEALKAEKEELEQAYIALKQACEQLEIDIPIEEQSYNNVYAVYDDFSKSIWSWYEEVIHTLDKDYMNTNNDNIVAFIEDLEEKMPNTFSVVSLALTDKGMSLGIEIQSYQQYSYVIQTLNDLDTVEIANISALTILDGGSSGLFEDKLENGDYNPTKRIRFTVNLNYTDAFRNQD